jgi:hypothetical protein
MTPMTKKTGIAKYTFDFESYGVFVRIECEDPDILLGAEAVARESLLNNLTVVADAKFDHIFEINLNEIGELMLTQNGQDLGASDTFAKLFKFFDSILRVSVAEFAPDRVFLHAGVVGWRGEAIVMPADSFRGKSTLVAELVRNGAEYYSDDFAVIDAEARVHPYPRRLSMRTDDFRTYDLTVDDLGGKIGETPIPIGVVLLTGYEKDAAWEPQIETAGTGVLKMIPFTLPIRNRPDFSMGVLHKISSHAIIISSLRGSAEKFAKTLLDFVDKRRN